MLVIYLLTMAPSLSFWDCGEFITCSYIMGIPHPPGSPLLSLMGRVMSLVPFQDFRQDVAAEIAYRVNMIDVILGALTVMLTYLVMVRLIHRFSKPAGSRMREAVTMFAAAIAAFMAAFSDEFWNNAIETETYMPAIFMSVLAVWLTLRWYDRKNDPSAVRYLFLSAYLIGLGNGVHLTTLLIAPTIFVLVVAAQPKWFTDSRLWISTGLFLIGAGMVKMFAGYEVLYSVMALFAFAAPVALLWFYKHRSAVWQRTLLGFVLCGSLYVIGYSVYPTVMVRAQTKPAINEGNPDNWERYKLYLDREQYGQENMYVGMFNRNASFSYQFGYMYLRYLIQQFPKWGPSVSIDFTNNRTADSPQETLVVRRVWLSVLLLSVLIYGLYTHLREDRMAFLALLLYFIATSVGLALYLNMDNPQVRDRAYFFLGSFYITMFWIGFGIWGIITDISDWLRSNNRERSVGLIGGLLMLLFATLVPASVLSRHLDPDFTNYEVHNRTHDWIPWDYGYNILISCEPNAILFTNGDNDTFPLWYLQEVMGVRRDVRIVNLSLLNTDWYILQLKHEGAGTVEMEYSDDHIAHKLAGRLDADITLRIWPADGQEVTFSGLTWTLPPYQRVPLQSGEMVGLLRIQDIMVTNIIKWVNWQRPIYFAVTVANENKIGLEPYLSMEGMVYRLEREPAPPGEFLVNVPVLADNAFNRYQYRALGDPTVYKPENSVKLVTNYFIGFAQLCERYSGMGDTENAVRSAWAAIERTPNDFERRLMLYQVFISNGMTGQLDEFIDWELEQPDFESDFSQRVLFYRLLLSGGMTDQIRRLVTYELDTIGFTPGVTGTVQDRMYLYTLMEQAGMSAEADSLVQMEMESGGIITGDIQSRLQYGTHAAPVWTRPAGIGLFREYRERIPRKRRSLESIRRGALYGRQLP